MLVIEQAIVCVKEEAAKVYPNKNFKVIVTDDNATTWFTSVVDEANEDNLMGWFVVDKATCEVAVARQ